MQFYTFALAWNEDMYARPVPSLVLLTQPKFWRRWPHHHLTQTSLRGQHRSAERGDQNRKVLSRRCAVVALTPSIQVVWRLPESWRRCEALRYRAEATFLKGSSQAERVDNTSSFYQHAEIGVYVNNRCITSRTITPKSQNTVTTTLSADGEHRGAVLYLLLYPSLCLPSDLQGSCRLQHFHKHCWAIYGCSPPFLALLQELYHS
jgi:hypothetical protein